MVNELWYNLNIKFLNHASTSFYANITSKNVSLNSFTKQFHFHSSVHPAHLHFVFAGNKIKWIKPEIA